MTKTYESIIEATCQATGITRKELLGSCRKQHLAEVRFIAALVMADNKPTGEPMVNVPRALNRHISWIHHATERAKDLIAMDHRVEALHGQIVELVEKARLQ